MITEQFDTNFFYTVICDIQNSKSLDDFVHNTLQHFNLSNDVHNAHILIRNKILFSDSVSGYSSFSLGNNNHIKQVAHEKLPIDLSNTFYISGPKVIATEKDETDHLTIYGQINSYGFISLNLHHSKLNDDFYGHFKNLIKV